MTDPRPMLVRTFADPAALQACWEGEVRKGRLSVSDDAAVTVLSDVTVTLVLDGQEVASLAARVVHLAPGSPGVVGLQVPSVPAEAEAAYQRALARPARPAAVEPEPATATADARPMALRYAEMTAPEKMQVALRGDRDGRLMVMKEGNPNLVKFLLQNPRTTPQEVATLAGNASSPLDLLNMISAHPMLAQNESIRVALVKNPRAPVPLVKQHLDKLSHGQLAQLGKSQHVRDEVRRMALKLVLSKRA